MASFSPGIAVHSLTGLVIHTPGSCLLNYSLYDYLTGWLIFLIYLFIYFNYLYFSFSLLFLETEYLAFEFICFFSLMILTLISIVLRSLLQSGSPTVKLEWGPVYHSTLSKTEFRIMSGFCLFVFYVFWDKLMEKGDVRCIIKFCFYIS